MKRLSPWPMRLLKLNISMRKKIIFIALLNLLVAVSVSANVIAQGPDPTPRPTPSADDVNAVAKNMYCPVCENTPLDVCETQACADWRDEIYLRLSEGWSDQEIYDYFVERHGDRVLAIPPARGLNWLIYIVPPLLLAVGALLVFRILRSSLRAPATTITSDIDMKKAKLSKKDEDEYSARIEDELNKRQ